MKIQRFETGTRMSRVVVHNQTVYLAEIGRAIEFTDYRAYSAQESGKRVQPSSQLVAETGFRAPTKLADSSKNSL